MSNWVGISGGWLAGSGKHWAVNDLQVGASLTVGYVVRAVISKIVPSIRSYVDIGESSLDMVQVPVSAKPVRCSSFSRSLQLQLLLQMDWKGPPTFQGSLLRLISLASISKMAVRCVSSGSAR